MSPIVFAYICLFTLLLAGAAAAVEWAAQGRGVARHSWTVAIVLAVLAPTGALGARAFEQRTAAPGAAGGQIHVLATVIVNSGRAVAERSSWLIAKDALIRMIAPSRRALRAALAGVYHGLVAIALVGWLVLSISLFVWLVAGVLHWRRARRSWTRTVLDGVSIEVSAATGPAVVGLLAHRIVLPSWVTTMQPEHRRLILAHESEHIHARDPERLMFAIAALVLMPWNVGLWWCAARLRRAIELDCDMRVLERYPSAKEYGRVLLEVAARGRNSGPLAIPMVALLRLPSELELRLRAMTRAQSISARTIAGGFVLACIAIGAAFTTPVPRVTIVELPSLTGATSRIHEQVPSIVDADRNHSASELDSINTLLRRLQERSAALERSRADLATTTAALRAAEQKTADGASANRSISTQRTSPPVADLRRIERVLHGYYQLNARVDSAIARYYPELVKHPNDRAVLWFVVDSAGKVIDTKRDDSFAHHVLSVDSVPARFPDISVASIQSVSLLGRQLNGTTVTAAWTILGSSVK